MNIVTVLTAVAVIGTSVFALEGLSVATGGEFYLASIQHLAQNSVEAEPTRDSISPPPITTETIISVPSVPMEPVPVMEPTAGAAMPAVEPFRSSDQTAPAPSDQNQPPPTPTSGNVMPRPFEPMQNFQGEPMRQDIRQQNVGQQNIRQDIKQNVRQEYQNGERNQSQNQTQGPAREMMNNSFDEGEQGENNMMDFVDPKEVQRTLKEISNMRNEIKRVIKQNKKTATEADISELNGILSAANGMYSTIKNSSDSDMRANMQEFYESQYWDKIQAIRTRLEIPRELKQMAPIFKRLEKTLSTKAIQNIGLDIGKARQRIAEMKTLADQVQAAYNSGDMETAQEAMQELRESGGHPGEIEGTIFRFRDIKNMVKRVKDEQVRNEVDSVLQEVVSAFNEGEYRQARETMDEYADDLQRLLNTLIRSRITSKNRRDSLNKIGSLENLIQSKLGNGGTQ